MNDENTVFSPSAANGVSAVPANSLYLFGGKVRMIYHRTQTCASIKLLPSFFSKRAPVSPTVRFELLNVLSILGRNVIRVVHESVDDPAVFAAVGCDEAG